MNDRACARFITTASVCVTLTIAAAEAFAQVGAGRPGRGDVPPVIAPAEIQRMFDAYALVQAQEQLKLADDKFPAFLSRFKALQDLRRTLQIERTRVLQQLRRLVNQGGDEAQIRAQLKTLQDVDAKVAIETQKAIETVDQVLDVRQQAQFRLFEELMERRKIELLMRARQANRLKNP